MKLCKAFYNKIQAFHCSVFQVKLCVTTYKKFHERDKKVIPRDYLKLIK